MFLKSYSGYQFLTQFVLVLILLEKTLAVQWQRSAFIYANSNRTTDQWRRHLIRIDSNGQFTNQKLFDAVIIVPDGDIVPRPNKFNEAGLLEVIDEMVQSATQLDNALNIFSLPQKTSVSLGILYFPPDDVTVELSGKKYRTSIPSQRDEVALWYVSKMVDKAGSANWKNLRLYGTYYQNEQVVQAKDDTRHVRSINQKIHALGWSTVWVPVAGSDFLWPDSDNGQQNIDLGFNVTVAQPGYSFLSSMDDGNLKGDRLYNLGHGSANLGRCFEYEVRSGETDLGHYIAHQYLAVAQVTGASSYPQVFFVGGMQDLFDNTENRAKSPGFTWATYEDLANYLRGDKIQNWEIDIPFAPTTIQNNLIEIPWTVTESMENLNSIRLDFSDPTTTTMVKNKSFSNNGWRGRVTIIVPGALNRPPVASFAHRMGSGRVNPFYNSVFVPLGNLNILKGTQLKIQLTREPFSTWPIILRLMAAKFEPPVIANPIFEEISKSSNPNPPNHFKDSQDTHLGFRRGGKLTDGQISPIDVWWWDGSMGWHWLEYPFSVTIDLGRVETIAKVKIVTHDDQLAAVGPPKHLGALVSPTCEPHLRGILGQSCVATGSTGGSLLTTPSKRGGDLRNLTMDFGTDPSTNELRGVQGRYVTVGGTGGGWTLFDEIEVVNELGVVVSKGSPYKIWPMTGSKSVDGSPYGDNYGRLLDGNIFSEWIFGTASDAVGITNEDRKDGGSVEATWSQVKQGNHAIVWFTKASPGFGIRTPDWVAIEWRDGAGQWQGGVKVPRADCGPSPCAKLKLPASARVTGIRGKFPQ